MNYSILSLDHLQPESVAWFQHKLDQTWDHGRIVNLKTSQKGPFSTVANTPSNSDEESVFGTTPIPESDNDTLKNANIMGIGLKEDRSHLSSLNMAANLSEIEFANKGLGEKRLNNQKLSRKRGVGGIVLQLIRVT